MRSIFIAVSKVFGLIQVYSCLLLTGTIVTTISGLFYASSVHGASIGVEFLFGIGAIAFSLFIDLALAWILIFKAEWLADKLKIPEQIGIDIPPKNQLLFIGIVLVGLYVSVEGAAQFGGMIFRAFASSGDTFSLHVTTPPKGILSWLFFGFLVAILEPALKLALGLLLTFKTRKIISWITKNEPAAESPQTDD